MDNLTVNDYMRGAPATIACQTPITQVVETLLHHHVTGLPVVDNKHHVVGFVSEQDCIRKLLNSTYYCEGDVMVNDVMHTDVMSVAPSDSLVELAEQMSGHKPKVYPVVQEQQLVGLISRADILKALVEHRSHCNTMQ